MFSAVIVSRDPSLRALFRTLLSQPPHPKQHSLGKLPCGAFAFLAKARLNLFRKEFSDFQRCGQRARAFSVHPPELRTIFSCHLGVRSSRNFPAITVNAGAGPRYSRTSCSCIGSFSSYGNHTDGDALVHLPPT